MEFSTCCFFLPAGRKTVPVGAAKPPQLWSRIHELVAGSPGGAGATAESPNDITFHLPFLQTRSHSGGSMRTG